MFAQTTIKNNTMKKVKKDNNPDNINEVLTVPQAAELLDISEFTLRKYLREGKIKGYKKFGKWFVFTSELKDFLKS